MRHAAFLAAGLLATAAQALLLRELVVDAAGDEASIGVGLSAWLLGIAAGACAARRRRSLAAPGDASSGLAALVLLPPLAIAGGRVLHLALAPGAGELPGLGHVLVLSLATLAPPGLAVGWTFTTLAAASSRHWEPGEGITRVYVVESAGSLVGGLAVTLLAGVVVAPLRLAALLGAAAAVLALAGARAGLLARAWAPAAALALSVAIAAGAGPLDAASLQARFAATAPGLPLRATTDTPYQHVALGGDDVLHLYAGGQYAASSPDSYGAETLGNLVALLTPRPRRVLMIGGWERGLVRVLLRHPVEELTVIEPDERACRFVLPWLPDVEREALEDPHVRLTFADPRAFFALPTGAPYDLVLLLAGEPATLLRARLATVELFAAVAARLSPDGAMVVPVRTAPVALAGETAALAGTLFRSVRLAATVVRATPGPDTLLVAGWSPVAVTLDPGVLAARWRERGVSSPAFDAAVLPLLLAPERVAAQEEALRSAAAVAETSRDDRPASFLHALARRQQTTAGAWGRLVGEAGRVPPRLLAVLALLPSLATVAWLLGAAPPARRSATAASHAVTVLGASGMAWCLLVLFSFQTRSGALYGALGGLTATFMLGLALGAGLAPRRSPALRALRVSMSAGLAFALVLPLALAAAEQAAAGGLGRAVLAYGGLLLGAGAVTGTVFPLAAEVRLATGEGAGEAAGRLETADHVGAAGAALFGAVLFVPVLGVARTAWLVAALVALALAGALTPPAGADTAS